MASLTYRFSSFTVPDPYRSAHFFARYTEAQIIEPDQWMTFKGSSATRTVGTRLYFANSFTDVYFWKNPANAREADMFSQLLEETHTFSADDWDWWQDWHVAFFTEDVDAVAIRLFNDGIPFVNRGGGLYFQVPGGVTIQVIGPPMQFFWSQPVFYFCRRTNDITARIKPYPLNITDVSKLSKRIKPFYPSHHSFVSSAPQMDQAFATSFLGFKRRNMKYESRPEGTHAYMHGRCAWVEWIYLPNSQYSVHYIEQYYKREGEVHVAQHLARLQSLRRHMHINDPFFGTRVGFSVPTIEPFLTAVRQLNRSYLLNEDNTSLLLSMPTGYLYELIVDQQKQASTDTGDLVVHPYGGLVPKSNNRDRSGPFFQTSPSVFMNALFILFAGVAVAPKATIQSRVML